MKFFLSNTTIGTPSAFIDIMRNVSMILLLLILILIIIVIVLNIVIVILIVIKPITEAYRSGASEVSSGTGV